MGGTSVNDYRITKEIEKGHNTFSVFYESGNDMSKYSLTYSLTRFPWECTLRSVPGNYLVALYRRLGAGGGAERPRGLRKTERAASGRLVTACV